MVRRGTGIDPGALGAAALLFRFALGELFDDRLPILIYILDVLWSVEIVEVHPYAAALTMIPRSQYTRFKRLLL